MVDENDKTGPTLTTIAKGVLDDEVPAEAAEGTLVPVDDQDATRAYTKEEQLAFEVINGDWGTGANIRRRLKAAGHNVKGVMAEVALLSDK